jgi:hypothetical protein
MTVNEMHIAIDLELNKLNSNLYDNILPQEKDYFLNRAQERLIKQRYGAKSNAKREGFEMSQKRIDDLQNLLVPNYYDKAYKLPTLDFDYETKVRFFLPNDYWFLTSQRSRILKNDCGEISVSDLEETFSYAVLPISEIPDANSFKIINTDTNEIYFEQNPYFRNDANLVTEKILSNFSTQLGFKLHKNKFKSITSEGNIIFEKISGSINLSYTINETFKPIVFKPLILSYYDATCAEPAVVVNNFAQQDDVYEMQNDPFNSTTIYSPLSIITEQNIDIFIDRKKFVVKEVAISYIRRPKLISLELNQSCELHNEIHSEIVREAVNLMLETIGAQQRLETSAAIQQTNE